MLWAIAALGLALTLILGWFGAVHPALDLISHFRLHLSAGLLIVLAFGFRRISGGQWLACLSIIAISGWLTIPHIPGFDRPTRPASPEVKLAQINLYFKNQYLRATSNQLTGLDVDFIVLQEVTDNTVIVLERLKEKFPYQQSCKYQRIGSVAIVSKHPFAIGSKAVCARAFGYSDRKFNVNGRIITVATYHSFWPWPGRQHRQIDLIKSKLERLKGPVLLAGDFNAAPWSDAAKRIAKYSGTQLTPGLHLTWLPLNLGIEEFTRWIGLPLDNTSYSKNFTLQKRYVLEFAGSDHRTVVSEFSWGP